MPATTFLEFAQIAAAAYNPLITRSAAGFGRYSPMRRGRAGFQGAIYRRGTDWVVGIAGTQPTDDYGADVLADVGFGGARGAGAAAIIFGTVGAALGTAGVIALSRQCQSAEELIGEARGAMAGRGTLTVTGHSLGGGLAQIMAARLNLPAVTFNPPSVTAVAGVAAAYARNKPKVVNLQVRGDPINQTGLVGGWLGKIVPLPTSRSGGASHSLDATIAELVPSGPFSTIGGRDPFGF